MRDIRENVPWPGFAGSVYLPPRVHRGPSPHVGIETVEYAMGRAILYGMPGGEPAVLVVRSAGAFRRDHGRAQRVLGGTFPGEGTAFLRFLQSLKHLSRDTEGRLRRRYRSDIKCKLRIVRCAKRPSACAVTNTEISYS